MIQINDPGIEFKSGIIFSVIALVFSVMAGLGGGVPAGVVFIRALIIVPVFFCIGFGVFFVMKNYVPELYDLLNRTKAVSDDIEHGGMEGTDIEKGIDVEPVPSANPEFTEFTEKDYDRLSTVNDSGVDEALNMPGAKLGKHIIVENQLNGYEPKIMAQAIRTMMSKDKD